MKSHSRRPRRDFSCPPDRTPRPRRAFPAMPQPRQAGRLFFSPHASPPALRRMPFTRRSLPATPPRLYPTDFSSSPARTTTHIRLTCLPLPNRKPPTAHLARTPRPRRAFPATTQPRQAGRLFFSPHASPPAGFFLPSRPHTHTPPHSSPRYTPIAHPPHKPRSTPPAPHPAVAAPSTAVFFLWRLFRLCRTGMIYSQKTFYF